MTYRPDEHSRPALRLLPDSAGATPADPLPAAGGSAPSDGPEPAAAVSRTRPPLLATKLRIPPAYQNVIARPRLLELLDQGLRRTVTVIAAPAGFGKTTLLGDWSRRTKRPTAWVSLDEGDNDPTRFWSYVIVALDQLHTGAGASSLALLQSPQPIPIEAVLTVLINDLADVAHDSVLVLDDYHLIEAQAVHQAVSFLVDHLPSQTHVVLTTRTEPPLPLARWRARGQLLEVRSADLRFQSDEAAAFLADSMDLRLTGQETAQLLDRTEGWIAGLQLIALSLKKQDDVARFIGELSGAQRFILDYLADEVLVRQSERVQAFLLQTSILERLNGDLCDAVTGQEDGYAVLEELERANLFVTPLDEERRWYRYHGLFAEFLRGRLQAQHSRLAATLHRRAAGWYEANGLAGDAIDHALAAAEHAEAAVLIEQAGQERLASGEFTTLQGWLDRLPAEVVVTHPRLCILQAWLLTFAFRSEQADRYLQRAEQAIASLADSPERRSLANEVAAMRATGAATQADWARLHVLNIRAEEHQVSGSDDNAFLRSVRHFNLALALELSGDMAASQRVYRELGANGPASGNVIIAMLALSQLGDQLVAQGHLRRAADTYREVLKLAARGQPAGDGPTSPISALAYFGLVLVLVEWNDLNTAEEYAKAGLDQGQQLGNPLIVAAVYVALARLHQARGNSRAALEALDRADEDAQGTELGMYMQWYTSDLRVRAWIAQGALSTVADWVERWRSGDSRGTGGQMYVAPLDALHQTTLLRALIALGRPRDALDLIQPLHDRFEAAGLGTTVIELLLLEALARHALGEQAPALESLARSLAMAAPEGFTRLFVDERPVIAGLLSDLQQSAAQGTDATLSAVPAAYLDHLIAACSPVPGRDASVSTPPAARRPSLLVETLSEREREVLRLVDAGLTNQAIAATLVVEVSTVKTHLLRLYGKLGVHSRTQAINRGRELHLLP